MPQLLTKTHKLIYATLITLALLLITACSSSAPTTENSKDPAPATETFLPDGWQTTETTFGNWAAEGWTETYAPAKDATQGVLLIHRAHSSDGAAMIAANLVSDTYFGNFPGFKNGSATWIEGKQDHIRIRKVPFTYPDGEGIIYAIENTTTWDATALLIAGPKLDAQHVTKIEQTLQNA